MQNKSDEDAGSFLDAISSPSDNPTQDSIENLSQALEAERDARMEERFIFILVIMILLDVVFFSVLDTWTAPLSLVILQIILLLVLARRMGIQEFQILIDRLIGRISEAIQSKS
ncbi:hypothetical protein WG926_11825 [Tistrella sp. BH-R2-4]|uniref:Uncharacterized protein n=1 Tax=Tistrella arctica TaxID=3133430 RepID=A0ABU9YJJ8_9PROT